MSSDDNMQHDLVVPTDIILGGRMHSGLQVTGFQEVYPSNSPLFNMLRKLQKGGRSEYKCYNRINPSQRREGLVPVIPGGKITGWRYSKHATLVDVTGEKLPPKRVVKNTGIIVIK